MSIRRQWRNSCNMIEEYLNKYLAQYFMTFPKGLVKKTGELFSETRDILADDISFRYKGKSVAALKDDEALFDIMQVDQCLEATFLYRFERAIFLRDEKNALLPYLASLMRLRTGLEIYYSTDIGPGLNIQHGFGIVIGPRNRIGKNFIIHQQVTIGQARLYGSNESASIGDNVTVFAGAKILGSLRVGDNVRIGANAVLVDDAEANSAYVGVPAKKVKVLNEVKEHIG